MRYDVVKGVQVDQSSNPNFQALQAAGQAGRFQGVQGMDTFGEEPQDDLDNIQPRAGFAYDLNGNGRNVIRGGGCVSGLWLHQLERPFPAIDASGLGHGPVFSVNRTTGIRKADGTLFRVGDPISTIESQNEADPNQIPLFGQVASPTLEQPYTRQANIGWAHQLSASTALTVDYVHIDGRDLNIRFRYNYRDPATGLRRLSDLAIRPNTQAFRAAISDGESRYDGLILGVRRRLTNGLDFTVSYPGEGDEQHRRGVGRARRQLHPGRDQPVCRRAAGTVGPHRCAPPDLGERGHPHEVGHPGRALLHLPLRASALHLRGCRSEWRQQQQRHHRRAYQYDGEGVAPRRLATARRSIAAAARTSHSSTCASRSPSR